MKKNQQATTATATATETPAAAQTHQMNERPALAVRSGTIGEVNVGVTEARWTAVVVTSDPNAQGIFRARYLELEKNKDLEDEELHLTASDLRGVPRWRLKNLRQLAGQSGETDGDEEDFVYYLTRKLFGADVRIVETETGDMEIQAKRRGDERPGALAADLSPKLVQVHESFEREDGKWVSRVVYRLNFGQTPPKKTK